MAERELGKAVAVAVARTLCALISPLPIAALRRIGAWLGNLAFYANSRSARTTRINIDLVYADKSADWRARTVRESLRQTGMTGIEAAAMWTWSPRRLRRLVLCVEGEELLSERRRGVLVLASHFGNWEALGFYLNTRETLVPLYQRPDSPTLDRALRKARQRLGHRPAPDTTAGLRLVLKTLREGGMASIMPDQVPMAGVGISAPFFGHPASTTTLVSKLLQRVEADVVFASAKRVRGGFSIRIDPVDDAVRDPDPLVSATALNAAVAAGVAIDPTQYQWEYKRYRFPGQPNMYR